MLARVTNVLTSPNLYIDFSTNRTSTDPLHTEPELIYNSITATGFSAMFTYQLDNTNNIAGAPLP